MKTSVKNISAIRYIVDERISEIREGIGELESHIGPASVHLAGALTTGLYIGPKPKRLSLNFECPFDRVVEADIRIILLEDKSPHDRSVISAISSVIQPDFEPKKGRFPDWHRIIPVTLFYKYDKFSIRDGLEWEFSLNQKPYVDVAIYWQKLFSQEEVAHQREIRKALYSLTPISYDDEYTPAKRIQTFEARWRLVANYAMAQLQITGRAPNNLLLPLRGVPEEPVLTLTQKWLAGESGYRTMERPEVVVPDVLKQRLQETLGKRKLNHLLIPPPQPEWVQVADAMQKDLMASFARQSALKAPVKFPGP